MKRLLSLAWCMIFLFPLAANGITLSEQAQIHVLTGAPGEPLFSAWGHSAFRVVDPFWKLDQVYNYGTFDFRTEGFYTKFAQGQLPYFLSTQATAGFVRGYANEGRKVKGQILNLSQIRTQEVYDYLTNNLKPENKFYRYDFFFDNCSTRERDVIGDVFKSDLDWRPWPVDSLGSLRDLLDIYLAERSWSDFGIDLLLGLPTDQEASMDLAIFLPDFLFAALDRAQIKTSLGWEGLVLETYVLVDPETPIVVKDPWLTSTKTLWFVLLFVLTLSILIPSQTLAARLFDGLIFSVIALLGILMLTFWLFTNHQATHVNFNLLWALPLHLVFAFMRLGKKKSDKQYHYSRWVLVWYMILALLTLIIPQVFHTAVLPLILLLCVRFVAVIIASVNED